MSAKKSTKAKVISSSPPENLSTPPTRRYSAFDELGFKPTIEALCEEIRELYLDDEVPWIIGYSGGKDSTATLQLIWLALAELPASARRKKVHVISTDTMVENPIVSSWVQKSLEVMAESARASDVPIQPHLLQPAVQDSFWVNLIGRGYPAPRHKFRWCTERLKIRPSNRFIMDMVQQTGEAILVLGTRKAESSRRAANMLKHEKGRLRERLSPNSSLPGSLVYTPVEDWTNDDVWMFLTQVKNPWGYSNRELMGMYAGASADGECPLVVDTSTPSCGDSRFGCWVCTLVEKDKSMTAMIQNDAEKEWMMPLLDLRNALDFRPAEGSTSNETDRHLRDFRRMSGQVHLFKDREIPGPYHQTARAGWLTQLLEAQTWIRANGPADVSDLELITLDEMQEIRRIWVVDKHELEDRLPEIYRRATGKDYPGPPLDDQALLGPEQMEVLEEICGEDRLHYELSRELLSLTAQQQTSSRRAGLYERLEKSIRKHFYESREDALDRAKRRSKVLETAASQQGAQETDTSNGPKL
ncbi:DNA phosphorothioation system sulfurtransferase DndC [Luteolibacter marinus]|uniref:DNA phosphorothioation system sulfurtransferase DndC n=1 Tax=Luteolibacter marinus TaxID=2776705 RepID=UPI0018693040|nr:DNA phosphorothioation system sulfurtransferase DndC [Luteolibacter marinus]